MLGFMEIAWTKGMCNKGCTKEGIRRDCAKKLTGCNPVYSDVAKS